MDAKQSKLHIARDEVYNADIKGWRINKKRKKKSSIRKVFKQIFNILFATQTEELLDTVRYSAGCEGS